MYGKIDEFRIWNTARTAAQIQANYDKTIISPQAGLVAYYKFDQLEDLGQGNAGVNDVRDFSGNNYHGDVRCGAFASCDAPVLLPPCNDNDGDGYTDCQNDCDENKRQYQPRRNGNPCNRIDENCDGEGDHDAWNALILME
ncbi:MAG: hypothetical protein IPM82_29890 [Saprospiraceae bacterium]|nr:hypothetical protein [Saprospiraceae bacterium]